MAHSITDLVKRFKQDWTRELEPQMIERACREAGHVKEKQWPDRRLGRVEVSVFEFFQ